MIYKASHAGIARLSGSGAISDQATEHSFDGPHKHCASNSINTEENNNNTVL